MSRLLVILHDFFYTNVGSDQNEKFKKLFKGLIVSNALLTVFDAVYVSIIELKALGFYLAVAVLLNVISYVLNQKHYFKLAVYIIVILNILIFPINTLLFSVHEGYYFISVLGGIILAVHLPYLYEFVISSVLAVIMFFIERNYFGTVIFPDKIHADYPVLFYVRTVLMFAVYSYWLYLYKRNHYLHSKIIAGKDLSLLKYMTAVDQSDATILITDKEGNIEYANPQIEKSTGYSVDEVIGKNLRIFQSEKTTKDTFVELLEQLEKGEPWKGTLFNRKKNKEECVVQAIISPVKNQLNEVVNYVAIKEDVTEHLKMLSELQESNEKYFQLAEQTNDIILVLDIKTLTVSYINSAILKIQGFLPEEIIGHSLKRTLTKESYECIVNDLDTHLKDFKKGEKSVFRHTYQMIHKNKQIIDIEVSAFFIVDYIGNPIEVHGIVRDITQQLKQQRELSFANRNLRSSLSQTTVEYKHLLSQMTNVLNSASSAICFFEIKENDIYFTSCNERWASNIGYTPNELVGKNIVDVVDKETLALYQKFVNQVSSSSSPLYEEIWWREMYLNLNIFPIKEKDGRKYCLCFIYNLTDKKKVEVRCLETEQRLINVFKISKEAIILLKPDLTIEQANESFYKILNIKEGKKIDNLVNVISYKNIEKLYSHIETLKTGIAFCQFETEVLSLNGDVVPVEMNLSLIKESQQPLLLCVIRDVSIRKNYEKKIIGASIKIDSQHRQKLASDLHDNVGPLLSSLNMCLSLLTRKPEVKKYQNDIDDINKILKDSILAVREISNNLSPRVLANHGLVSALETFFETKQKLVNIDFTHNIGSIRFDEIKEAMIYNVIKEVFNNSLKYSQSSEIELKISKRFNYIVVKYQDFGVGFDFDEKVTPASDNLGLFSMINRFKILEGEYRIKTAPGEGFLLNLMFPI
nr:PAS domain S-box protein [uncultured Carboxylicivirga sp.]